MSTVCLRCISGGRILGNNIMEGENLEIDFPKTALPKMPRACKPQGIQATDPYNKLGVVPGVYVVFLKC